LIAQKKFKENRQEGAYLQPEATFIEHFIILHLLYLLYIYISDWKTISKQFQIEKGHCEAIQATKNDHENIIMSSDLLE